MSHRADYSAMTVNERLFTVGLMDAFAAAARSRDRDAMIHLLAEVGLDQPAQTADALLTDPARYGY